MTGDTLHAAGPPNPLPLKGTPMTLDPTLRDQLAKTIHDAVCPCAHFLDRHPATRKNYRNAADKAAELLTAPRFPDGWERGHEAKYWVQTGLTPYGLTLDPERAPGVLNWLGVNYYTPDSPHLPASAAAPIVLPTVEEVARTIMLDDGYPHRDPAYLTNAQAVLDLIASRVRHWVPVEPGTLIKAGTHYRIECCDGSANEHVASFDRKTDESWPVYIDPATVPAEPEDPRLAVVVEWGSEPAAATRKEAAHDLLTRLDALQADR